MFGSSGRVRFGFDPLICGFFGFSLFRVRVEKIVFKTQNFRAGSGRVFGSGQFLTGPVTTLQFQFNLTSFQYSRVLNFTRNVLPWLWRICHDIKATRSVSVILEGQRVGPTYDTRGIGPLPVSEMGKGNAWETDLAFSTARPCKKVELKNDHQIGEIFLS